MKVYTTQPGLGVGVNLITPNQGGAIGIGGAGGQGGDGDTDLNKHERERVIELMLSPERVISLLYDKTFPMTSMEMDNVRNMQDVENIQNNPNGVDIDHGYGQEVDDPNQYGDEDDQDHTARLSDNEDQDNHHM